MVMPASSGGACAISNGITSPLRHHEFNLGNQLDPQGQLLHHAQEPDRRSDQSREPTPGQFRERPQSPVRGSGEVPAPAPAIRSIVLAVSRCGPRVAQRIQGSKYTGVNVDGCPRRRLLPLLRIASATC